MCHAAGPDSKGGWGGPGQGGNGTPALLQHTHTGRTACHLLLRWLASSRLVACAGAARRQAYAPARQHLRATLLPPPPLCLPCLPPQALMGWRTLALAVRPRVLWVAAHYLELPAMLEDTWSCLLACVEDTLLKLWRLESDAHTRLLAASARDGVLFKRVALPQLVRGGRGPVVGGQSGAGTRLRCWAVRGVSRAVCLLQRRAGAGHTLLQAMLPPPTATALPRQGAAPGKGGQAQFDAAAASALVELPEYRADGLQARGCRLQRLAPIRCCS